MRCTGAFVGALECRWSRLAGTVFVSTKLPLRTLMLAMYFLTSTTTNMAVLELMRHLGVNCKAAWRLKHKIMQAMAMREQARQLSGFVQIDDAYLGGGAQRRQAGARIGQMQNYVCRKSIPQSCHSRLAILLA